jgi:hypothetical protein
MVARGERRRGGAAAPRRHPRNRPLHVGCRLVLGYVYMGGWPIFFGAVGCFEILWLGYVLRLAWLRILHVFSLIIKNVSFKTYKHQNLWNLLVINPILSSMFRINGFYVGFWQLKSCIKDHQQAPPHMLFACPRAKLFVTMDHDFKRYDACIKIIPCHSLYLWIFEVYTMAPWAVEKWNGCDTKSSLSLYEAYLEFLYFWNWKQAHTSPQMVFSCHSMVFISLPKASAFAFFFILLLKRHIWSFG